MSGILRTPFRKQTFDGPPVRYHGRIYSSAITDPVLSGFILLRNVDGNIEIVSKNNRGEIEVLLNGSSQIQDLQDVPME